MVNFNLIDDSQELKVELLDDNNEIEFSMTDYDDTKVRELIDDTNTRVDNLRHHVNEKIDDMEDYVDREINNMQSDLDEFESSVNRQFDDVSSDISTLEGKVSTNTGNIAENASNIAKNTANINKKQDKLISGQNIKTINNESVLGSGNINIEGVTNYEELNNLPSINNVELKGNKTSNDLGLQQSGDYALRSEIPDVSDFITKDVNNLTNYTLKTNTGSLIDLEINQTTYVVTLTLKDQDGNTISTDTIDLPLESVVVSGSYDSTNQKIVLTLQNGTTIDIPVGALIAGLQTEITSSNKLASDLVDDTNSGNKFVTTTEKSTWNSKYNKPNTGIPKTDLSSTVQSSLDKADTALQEHQSLDGCVKKDGGSASQTVSLTSGTGTTALGLKSMASSSYMSMSGTGGWLGSYGVSSDKKPVFYNGTGYTLAYTSDVPKIFYGKCVSPAATQAKVVECDGFVLEEGATISVLFTNSQTYNGAPTLNVNGSGAKTIQYKQGTNGIRYMWQAGAVIDFTYNGTYWVMHRSDLASTLYYGLTKLATSAISTSTSTALTPASLNNLSQHMISGAPLYSASATYEVGDRVRYGYYTYKCITAITTAEAWTTAHWEALDPLQEQIDNIYTYIDNLNGNGVSY